jgi:hypothetical protein
MLKDLAVLAIGIIIFTQKRVVVHRKEVLNSKKYKRE